MDFTGGWFGGWSGALKGLLLLREETDNRSVHLRSFARVRETQRERELKERERQRESWGGRERG